MNLKERNQKQRTFFNEKINEYDLSHQEFMETKKSLADSLDKDAKRVLDLGAGTGLELIHLYELFPNMEVTVVDITENMLAELKKRSFGDKVNTICGDFFEVEFGAYYDAVISTSALHHFKKEEKEVLYKKIYDCLKENGQFINCDKIAKTQEIEDKQLYELEHNIDKYKHIDTPLTVEHELEVINGVGFKDSETSKVDKENYALFKARK